MKKQLHKPWLTKSIALLVTLIVISSLFIGCSSKKPTPGQSFIYQVWVHSLATGKAIKGAKVTIVLIDGKAPLYRYTDDNGFARIIIDSDHLNKPGKISIEADGYNSRIYNVDLTKGDLPSEVYLPAAGQTVTTATPNTTNTPPAPTSSAEHTPIPEPIPTTPPTPEPIPANTSPPQPTIANTATPQQPTSPPSSQADAVVLAGGASLRPGADTWWYARDTLPAGTELELAGYDPNFAGWVYVCTVDGAKTGWTQTASLQINVQLPTLPRVTPRPTLTATPGGAGQSTPSSGCSGGSLTLTFYHDPGSEHCTSGSGWAVNIHFIVSGGNCTYTYYWENELIYGPTTQSEYIYTVEHGDASLVGNGEVRSGSESVKQGVYVDRLNCP